MMVNQNNVVRLFLCPECNESFKGEKGVETAACPVCGTMSSNFKELTFVNENTVTNGMTYLKG